MLAMISQAPVRSVLTASLRLTAVTALALRHRALEQMAHQRRRDGQHDDDEDPGDRRRAPDIEGEEAGLVGEDGDARGAVAGTARGQEPDLVEIAHGRD